MENKNEKKDEIREELREEQIPYYARKPKFENKGPSKLRQQFANGMTYLLVIGVCVCLYFILLRFQSVSNLISLLVEVTKPIIYGFVIAYLLNPIVKKIDSKLLPALDNKMGHEKAAKVSRTVGISVSLLFLLAVITALCNMLIPELFKSIRNLVLELPGQISEMMVNLEKMQVQDNTMGMIIASVLEQGAVALETWLRTDLMSQINTVVTNVTAGIFSAVGEVFNFLVGLIVSVYVLFGKERFSKNAKKVTYAFFSTSHANMILHLTKKSNEIFGGFLIGKILDSAIIGVICFVTLTIMNMPYTLLVSVVVGVTNIIPFFGPFIGAIPSAILILLADPVKGFYFIIFVFILQQLDGNVIGPKILGDSTGVSAFGVIFSILIGGGLFGFVGMIMGVPTFALTYYVVMMLAERKLEKKNLPLELDDYGEMSYVDEFGNYVSDPSQEEKKGSEEEQGEIKS